MAAENNLQILQHAIENFSAPHTHDAYFDLYAEDTVLHGYAGVEPGLASIKQFYLGLWAAFPDAKIQVEEMLAVSDKVVCRFVLHATHQGEFAGVPATGKHITLPGITILRFADGKCIERWSQADFLGLLGQIGALPIPA